jgi:hypothetical protein
MGARQPPQSSCGQHAIGLFMREPGTSAHGGASELARPLKNASESGEHHSRKQAG